MTSLILLDVFCSYVIVGIHVLTGYQILRGEGGGNQDITLCIMRINANFMTGRTILRFKSFDFDNLRV